MCCLQRHVLASTWVMDLSRHHCQRERDVLLRDNSAADYYLFVTSLNDGTVSTLRVQALLYHTTTPPRRNLKQACSCVTEASCELCCISQNISATHSQILHIICSVGSSFFCLLSLLLLRQSFNLIFLRHSLLPILTSLSPITNKASHSQ